jgi:CRISPR/Cas system-associated endonuclease Cas3-HD
MDYAAHIARICKIEDIAVESHSSGGRAYRQSRRIKIRQVKTAITYAVALHEIGHILGPRQTGKNTRLDKEVGAWEWAEQHALEWTEAMSAKRAKCLQSYLAKAARSPHMKRPTAEHPIFAMVAP